MNNEIAKFFYDKTITVLTYVEEYDDEGGLLPRTFSEYESFKGNVNFSNCKKIQQDYGIEYNVDITITTNYSTLTVDNFLKYEDVVYKITDLIACDSHFLILASKV